MLKISSSTIEQIADDIVSLIRQGKLLKTAEGGGWQSKDSDKDKLKRKWDEILKPLELGFRKGIVVLFKEQRDLVIAVLQGRQKSLEKDIKDNAKKAATIPVSKAEIDKLKNYTLPKITNAVEVAGNAALAELEVGIAFDVLNPAVVEWLKEHAAEAVTQIGETTQKALRKTLLEGIENGESIAKLTKRVQAEYKHLELEEWRAKRISLTETKDAVSRGNLEGYRQSELTGKKGILLAGNPCDICLDFEGMGLIKLDDTWGGFDCPSFHPNCHCDIYFEPE